jgi:ferrous-iron efflux pump FieF
MNASAAATADRLQERGSITFRAAMASVLTALFLIALKSYASLTTHSVAMLASLADSGLDLAASLVNLYGVHLAAQPADRDHKFGHGKAEALAAMFQVVLIAVAALAIGWRGVSQLATQSETMQPEYGIGASLVATAVTLLLVAYQRHAVARTGSVAIHADNLHYSSDVALNLSVILALVLDAYFHIHGADALFGVLIALWLLRGAFTSSSHAIDQLMDKEWPAERRQRFLAVAAQHPELKGIHDLRTRTSGAHDFVQFHVWVDPQMTVLNAHRVMDEVEAELQKAFPGVEILIHPDPEGHMDELNPE